MRAQNKIKITASFKTNPTNKGAIIDMMLAEQFVMPIKVPLWFGAKSK